MSVMDPELEESIIRAFDICALEIEEAVELIKKGEVVRGHGVIYHLLTNIYEIGDKTAQFVSEADWKDLEASGWRPDSLNKWLSVPENKEYYDRAKARENQREQDRVARIVRILRGKF